MYSYFNKSSRAFLLTLFSAWNLTLKPDLHVCIQWCDAFMPWFISRIQYLHSVYFAVVKSLSCSTLCDPVDCSLPGSSVHGIFQARILEWVAISFSRGSSWPRDCLHCRQTLYHLSHQESPFMVKFVYIKESCRRKSINRFSCPGL